jgi:hypothetical protein
MTESPVNHSQAVEVIAERRAATDTGGANLMRLYRDGFTALGADLRHQPGSAW